MMLSIVAKIFTADAENFYLSLHQPWKPPTIKQNKRHSIKTAVCTAVLSFLMLECGHAGHHFPSVVSLKKENVPCLH